MNRHVAQDKACVATWTPGSLRPGRNGLLVSWCANCGNRVFKEPTGKRSQWHHLALLSGELVAHSTFPKVAT